LTCNGFSSSTSYVSYVVSAAAARTVTERTARALRTIESCCCGRERDASDAARGAAARGAARAGHALHVAGADARAGVAMRTGAATMEEAISRV